MTAAIKSSYKTLLTALFLAVFAVFTASAQGETANAENGKTEHQPEKFDAGKLILEHIGDSHEWHLFTYDGHAVAIPLPVILYTPKGVDVFMSSRLEENEEGFNSGKYTYKIVENHVVPVTEGKVDEAANAGIYDLSITKNVVTLFISAFLILFVFLSVAGAYTRNANKAPSGMQSFFEPVILFIRDDIAKTAIGPKYEKFMPYLLTVFFFIWFNNMLGIIPIFPGGANLTGNIAITGILAFITFLIVLANGNKHYWHHILAMPGVPKAVLLILTPIEIMGVFLRPFVLMIRLFANITAGHIIALAFFCLIFIFGEMNKGLGFGVGIFSVAFNVFMGLMEVLVALIQAYVFTLLSAIYFGAAVEEPHEHQESIV